MINIPFISKDEFYTYSNQSKKTQKWFRTPSRFHVRIFSQITIWKKNLFDKPLRIQNIEFELTHAEFFEIVRILLQK